MNALTNAIVLEAMYQNWINGYVRDCIGRRAYFAELGWVRNSLAEEPARAALGQETGS